MILSGRKFSSLWLGAIACVAAAHAQTATKEPCPRPSPGEIVREPEDLRSKDGVLEADLAFQSEAAGGSVRYCYRSPDGAASPNIRVHPGDLLILHLKNNLAHTPDANRGRAKPHNGTDEPCEGGMAAMTNVATNLHFHGLSIPPVCHQDDVLRTAIQPSDPPFEYRIRIPQTQPSGLYWYHPHLHGFSKVQVLGGASGALIIEGIERSNHAVAGMPERVFVIRDQDLLNPGAGPTDTPAGVVPGVNLDRDGDAQNTGNGTGKPAKDLSLNFVPVPYPLYPPAVIQMRAGERQFWRVVNASAITYLNLQILWKGVPQGVGVVALDGVPLNQNGLGGGDVVQMNHLGVAPGGRVEFVVTAPPAGVAASLATRAVNTGPGGENDPTRPIANIVSTADGPEPQSSLPPATGAAQKPSFPWLGNVKPVRTRHLYFSEKLQDPKDPNSPTTFFLTVEGQVPAPFDPSSREPNIVVHVGDVEDWIIENRSQELHDFHIHQIHYMLVEWFGIAVNEPFLRDTINVPFWDGKATQYPSVRLRMDFRDPSVVGTFPYHCHLLEHEDGGMMGTIRVEAVSSGTRVKAP
jgi:FtsP/CotA-like multicopper oxidase with cupredoxin domain